MKSFDIDSNLTGGRPGRFKLNGLIGIGDEIDDYAPDNWNILSGFLKIPEALGRWKGIDLKLNWESLNDMCEYELV